MKAFYYFAASLFVSLSNRICTSKKRFAGSIIATAVPLLALYRSLQSSPAVGFFVSTLMMGSFPLIGAWLLIIADQNSLVDSLRKLSDGYDFLASYLAGFVIFGAGTMTFSLVLTYEIFPTMMENSNGGPDLVIASLLFGFLMPLVASFILGIVSFVASCIIDNLINWASGHYERGRELIEE